MFDFSQLDEFYIGGKGVQELYISGSKVWQKQFGQNGLKFTSKQDGSTIKLQAVGSPNSISIEYSLNRGMTYSPYTIGTTITLPFSGSQILFRAGSGGNSTIGNDGDNHYKFVMTGEVACRGNILFLLNQSGTEPQGGLPNYCFVNLFRDCTALVSAPELPATTLGSYCYISMFRGCSSLVTAPELPATTLKSGCYRSMFQQCSSLVNAPELPATTLGTECYSYMFQNCTSLNEIKLAYTGSFESTYFNSWVSGVQTTGGTFYYNGSDTTRGASAIPENWTITTF